MTYSLESTVIIKDGLNKNTDLNMFRWGMFVYCVLTLIVTHIRGKLKANWSAGNGRGVEGPFLAGLPMFFKPTRSLWFQTAVLLLVTDRLWLTPSGGNGSQHRKSPYMAADVWGRKRVWETTSSRAEPGWPDWQEMTWATEKTRRKGVFFVHQFCRWTDSQQDPVDPPARRWNSLVWIPVN